MTYTDFEDDVFMEKAAEWEMFKEAQKRRRAKLAPGSRTRPLFGAKTLNARFRAAGGTVTPEMARGARRVVEGVRKVNRKMGGNVFVRMHSDPAKRAFGFRGRVPMTKSRAEKLLKQLGISPQDLKKDPLSAMRRMQGTPLANMDPKDALNLIFPKEKPAISAGSGAPQLTPKNPRSQARAAKAVAGGGGGGASKSLLRNPYAIGAGLLGAGYIGKKLYDRSQGR